ncbi:acylneuraminate cytidylyltransferase family protein [Roseivirga thermotolerans]|uniref:acylneuraminate cytidylyltransferase family protein n=1 Tax=Roseivirga thermotolerans TaxID=1758176 RepID=UPI00167B73BB|nr:acylneuraminate cytidylyltransferase family protein [Roseivirga thermotolerans]
MSDKPKLLGLIPARGGSKGVPGKNIKDLNGKPLISYTIDAAKSTDKLDRLIVSTDSEEIATVCKELGAEVPFIRPDHLATDTARAIGVIQHALEFAEEQDGCVYDLVVYLEPPNPLRLSKDIDNCIDLFFEKNPDSVVSVQEANQFHPILMKKIENGLLKPIWRNEPEGVPRQLYDPTAYMRNGAVYIFRREHIKKGVMYGEDIVPYVMPIERSVCIDDMMDWYVAEAWIKYGSYQ